MIYYTPPLLLLSFSIFIVCRWWGRTFHLFIRSFALSNSVLGVDGIGNVVFTFMGESVFLRGCLRSLESPEECPREKVDWN